MRKTWKALVLSARGAGTWYSDGLALEDGVGLWLALHIDTASGFTLDVSLEVLDPNENWIAANPAIAFAQQTVAGSAQLWVHPELTTATGVVKTPLPALVRVKAVVGTASCTFSVGASELL